MLILLQQSSGSLGTSSTRETRYREASNIMTKITGICGAIFMIVAMSLAIIMKSKSIIANETNDVPVTQKNIDISS